MVWSALAVSEINSLRINKNRVQRLIVIEQEIFATQGYAELHIKRVWRDVEKQFADNVMVKTASGWQRLITLLEPEIIKTFPEDTVEVEIINVTKHGESSHGEAEA